MNIRVSSVNQKLVNTSDLTRLLHILDSKQKRGVALAGGYFIWIGIVCEEITDGLIGARDTRPVQRSTPIDVFNFNIEQFILNQVVNNLGLIALGCKMHAVDKLVIG